MPKRAENPTRTKGVAAITFGPVTITDANGSSTFIVEIE
jgi:hypothetical protein